MSNEQAEMTPGDVQQVIGKQVANWRAEVARLNDLIGAAMGGEQASAGSIGDDAEFNRLIGAIILEDNGLTNEGLVFELATYIDSRPRQAEQASTDVHGVGYLLELPCSFSQVKRLDGTLCDAFTPNQMRAYARAAIALQAPTTVRDAALEDAAERAEWFGIARPMVSARPIDLVRGRWEGEQAASTNIAVAIRTMKSSAPKLSDA